MIMLQSIHMYFVYKPVRSYETLKLHHKSVRADVKPARFQHTTRCPRYISFGCRPPPAALLDAADRMLIVLHRDIGQILYFSSCI